MIQKFGHLRMMRIWKASIAMPSMAMGTSRWREICLRPAAMQPIIMHGLVLRYAEDKVWLSTLYPWIVAAARGGNYDVTFEETTTTRFIFQLSGPKSLEIIEAAAEKDLHDIPFLGFQETTIPGKPVTVLRMTMCGTLGYEVHGSPHGFLPNYNKGKKTHIWNRIKTAAIIEFKS